MPRPNPETTTQSIPWRYQSGNTVTTGFTSVNQERRTWSGTNTPGYPDVRPLPFRNHYTDFQRRFYDPKFEHRRDFWFAGKFYSIQEWWKGASAGYGTSMPTPMDHVTSSMLYDGADRRAKAKVISDIQRIKMNVAQNVAEYRQVSNMFATNVRRITLAYRALRRGDIDGLSRQVNMRRRHKQSLLNRGPLDIRANAPSIWLEVQYGWRPLLGDVYTGVSEFYKSVESGYTIRAVGRATYKTSSNKKVSNVVGGADFDDFTERVSRCKYIIDYQVDSTQLANMDDWGITNPLLLAWELVPYSFVVDWFYPVGDWLSQVGYSLGLYFQRGMRSSLATAQTVRRFKPVADSAYPYFRTCQGTDGFHSSVFHREVIGAFPSPGRPRVDPDGLRGKRILNALSLLALAFDRKPRGSR